MHFESAAQYRLSQEELEKSRYGTEVARLKLADILAKKGLDAGKRGVAESVMADLRVNIQSISLDMELSSSSHFKLRSNQPWSVL